MKHELLIAALLATPVAATWAQEPIYRCGNEYTNTRPDAHAKGCKLVEGGNVTVVQGLKPQRVTASGPANSAPPPNGASRIASVEQRARDSDARLILQSELKKAQIRQEELQKEYNQGQPEKRGDEARNHQKYLDRVAELKASLARNESDMSSIKRELDRLPSTPSTAQTP